MTIKKTFFTTALILIFILTLSNCSNNKTLSKSNRTKITLNRIETTLNISKPPKLARLIVLIDDNSSLNILRTYFRSSLLTALKLRVPKVLIVDITHMEHKKLISHFSTQSFKPDQIFLIKFKKIAQVYKNFMNYSLLNLEGRIYSKGIPQEIWKFKTNVASNDYYATYQVKWLVNKIIIRMSAEQLFRDNYTQP